MLNVRWPKACWVLIWAIELPALHFAELSTYRQVQDRASYASALVSVAAAPELDRRRVKDVRIAPEVSQPNRGARGGPKAR